MKSEDVMKGAVALMREKHVRDLLGKYTLSLRVIHMMVENNDFFKPNSLELLKICLEDLMNLLEEIKAK